ncbi:MAG: DUF4135 domain-containing protein [Gemmatimonadota bacterium]
MLKRVDLYVQKSHLPIDRELFSLRAQAYVDVLTRTSARLREFDTFNDPRFCAALSDVSLIAELAVILDRFVTQMLIARSPGTPAGFKNRAEYQQFLQATIPGHGAELRTTYPLLDHAFNEAQRNFAQNLEKLCTRLKRDWVRLGEVFRTPLDSLKRIEGTGSDFHKQGGQTLILEFAPSFKLVYKPTDLELDYWVAGRTDRLAGVPGFPARRSLSELLNAVDGDERVALPTYTIFPAVRGSQNADMAAALRDSYGYLEFIPYDEYADEPSRMNYFYQVGKIAGIAAALSMRDVHQENLIVAGAKPTLIDMEASLLEPTETVGRSGLLLNLQKGTAESNPYYRMTSGQPAVWTQDSQGQRTKNVIREDGDPILLTRDYVLQVALGYQRVLTLLIQNLEVPAWLERLANVTVRHVPYPTKDLFADLMNFYTMKAHSQLSDARAKCRTAFYDEYRQNVSEWNRKVRGDEGGDGKAWTLPNFLTRSPAHMGRDFESLDVPSFYGKPSSSDLYDSRGVPVRPAERVANELPACRATYFPEPPIDQLRRQFSMPVLNQRLRSLREDIAELLMPTVLKTMEDAAQLVEQPVAPSP